MPGTILFCQLKDNVRNILKFKDILLYQVSKAVKRIPEKKRTHILTKIINAKLNLFVFVTLHALTTKLTIIKKIIHVTLKTT